MIRFVFHRARSSSRPEEFHLRALPEPCMTLSSHTAPDVRPLLERLCLVHGLLLFPVGQRPRPNNAAPSLPRHYPASSVSGRRRRARLLSRWPPSAAQTGRAVFPHPAFTKTKLAERQWKGSSRLGSQARTHRRAYCVATFSNRSSATYGADATRSAAPAIRRAGGRAFGRGPACSGGPSPARRD